MRRPTIHRVLAIPAVLVLCAGLALPAQTKISLRKIEQLVAHLEEIYENKRGDHSLPMDVEYHLARFRLELNQHLAANPSDVEALMLAGRAERAQRFLDDAGRDVTPPATLEEGRRYVELVLAGRGTEAEQILKEAGSEVMARPTIEGASRYLDRALELAPDRADLHYWQSRNFQELKPVRVAMTGVPGGEHVFQWWFSGDTGYEAWRLDEAITHAARAVELDEHGRDYRLNWGLALAQAGRFEEAETVLRPLDRGQHRAHLLVRDLNAVPIPAAAAFSYAHSGIVLGRLLPHDQWYKHGYHPLHVRAFTFPGPAAEFVSSLREIWPELELFDPGKDGFTQGLLAGARVMGFNWKGDAVEPVAGAAKAMKADVSVWVVESAGGGPEPGPVTRIYLSTPR